MPPHVGTDRRGGISGGDSSRFVVARTGQRNKKGLLGLSNLGNTCFMNAALQCLTHTHGMQKYFRFCSHAYTSRGQSSRYKLLMAFAHWFERDWGKDVSAHYHTPEDILRSVQQLNPIFQGYAQQDAQEFLRCVLDNIHEELRREVPDDLRSRFGQCCNSEDSPQAPSKPSENMQTGSGQVGHFPSSSSDLSFGAGGSLEPRREQSSTTQRIMQFCQTSDGYTDAGEIRLPSRGAASSFNRPLSDSGIKTATSSSFSSSSSSCATPAAREEANEGSGEGSSTSSTAPKTHFVSIVSELFQGRIVSMVRCLDCHRISRTSEVTYDVSVPIPNPNEPTGLGLGESSPLSSISSAMSPASLQRTPSSALRGPTWSSVLGGISGKVKSWFYDKGVDVSDCVRRYCAPEYLTGKDQYFCERCKRKNDCEKRIVFKDLPEVLCIHIKRFRYDTSWFNGTKNSRVVTFPVTTTLDMAPFLEEPSHQPVEYRLIGLIQHIGSMGSGHYIAYCQHKRKPQEWYEFDDMQVSLVSAEQVERAEPYVLFYQRVPSKACRMDRQNFKKDMRSMEGKIRDYLMTHPSSSSSSTSRPRSNSENQESESAAPARQLSAQAVHEEMRHQGPALRSLYLRPPSELDMVFVSKHWYVRLTTMSYPGPLDNNEYLCPHSQLGWYSSEMAAEPFVPISRSLFRSLVSKYGGSPEISCLETCTKCQSHLRAYNDRKQAEFELVSKYDTKDTGDGQAWYLVDACWVNNWKRYVKSDRALDIRDLCAPGPITNDRLFDKAGQIRPNLRLRLDYIGVNARVWWLFMHVHGGGSPVVREELEIYSPELKPEIDLVPDELQPCSGSDYSMRISRQYVDECHGDLELYQQLFGGRTDEGESCRATFCEDVTIAEQLDICSNVDGAYESKESELESSLVGVADEPPGPTPCNLENVSTIDTSDNHIEAAKDAELSISTTDLA